MAGGKLLAEGLQSTEHKACFPANRSVIGMIEQILNTNFTVTTTVLQQPSGAPFLADTSWIAFIALILGVVASALSIALTAMKINEYLSHRSRAALALLAPKLREIRTLLDRSWAVKDVERAYAIYDDEIIGKGLDHRLEKLERLRKRDYKRRFGFLFSNLYSRTLDVKMHSHQEIISLDEEAVRLKFEVVNAIDRILEKSWGD
jgi:hypothetical protein